MTPVELIARQAGFRKADEITTNNTAPTKALGLDVVPSEIMPEGWLGLRTEKGVTCMGPDGQVFFVPAFDQGAPKLTTFSGTITPLSFYHEEGHDTPTQWPN